MLFGPDLAFLLVLMLTTADDDFCAASRKLPAGTAVAVVAGA